MDSLIEILKIELQLWQIIALGVGMFLAYDFVCRMIPSKKVLSAFRQPNWILYRVALGLSKIADGGDKIIKDRRGK